MKKIDLSKAVTEELLNLYIRLSIEQGEAAYGAETSRVNRLGDTLYEIGNEIKRRPDDRGASLRRLFRHPSARVRFNAAASLSGVFTAEARQVMQEIADSEFESLAFDAMMYLRSLDEWIRRKAESEV